MTSRRPASKKAATEVSIQAALRGYMQHAPRPFAITVGAEHNLVYVNAAFSRLIGVDNGDALGAPIGNALTAAEREAISPLLDQAFRNGVELLDESVSTSGERATGWRFSVWPVIADNGRTEALGVEIRESVPSDEARDLQRQVAEQMLLSALRERGFADDAEAARRRAAFLAEAGRILAESVDQSSTLLALTRLALPAIGAWCIVDIIDDDESIRRLAIYHPDPDKQRIVLGLEASWTPQPDDLFGGPAMLRSARTTAITDFIEATLAATARSPRSLTLLRQLGIGSFLTVPLIARNRLLGAITFVSAQQGNAYSPEDIQLAEDVANRGALALDSAQVYDLALVLQRSAETANRAKTAFLGAMSHELRTPLNAIGGYIDILDMGLRGPVTASQHAAFARVKTNQQHLALLITEILNFSRVGSGQLPYVIKDVKACAAVQHTIELIEPLFGQKGIVFEGVSGDSTITARADPERVTQILINLLSNSIKFTPAGGHIGADCAASADTVSIRIHDTGIGIAGEKHESIFEPFIQLRESLSDRESGVGLGLAISRDLARAMNGDLTVESSEGNGSRFTLSLPRASES
jgi:signal transduction histidine kinase